MIAAPEDKKFLQEAIVMARHSVDQGGFPAGAVIARQGKIIARGLSIGHSLNDPTSHGEMAAIREACRVLQTNSLADCVLYDSLEPCLMCFGASSWSGIPKIVFACAKDKVSADYYGGHYHADLLAPIAMIHCPELEASSLKVVHDWEKGRA